MVLNLAKSPLSSIYPCIFLFQCLFHSILLSFTFPWLRTRLKPHLAIHPSPFPHYFTLNNRNGEEGGGRLGGGWVGAVSLIRWLKAKLSIYFHVHLSFDPLLLLLSHIFSAMKRARSRRGLSISPSNILSGKFIDITSVY